MNLKHQSKYFGAYKSCTEVMLIPLQDPILLRSSTDEIFETLTWNNKTR